MAAIVTSKFRITNASNFKEDIADSANTSVYVYIAKSDVWSDDYNVTSDGDPDLPRDQQWDQLEVNDNIIAMKRVTASDVSHVIPRKNWTAGMTYDAWDSKVVFDFDLQGNPNTDLTNESIYDKDFYVITTEFKVYKCLDVGYDVAGNIKTVNDQPTATIDKPFYTDDGYLWKYMYTLQVADSDKFLTNFYMPIKTVVDDGNLDAIDQDQYNKQVSNGIATQGRIYRLAVDNPGSGYTDGFTQVVISGDGNLPTYTVPAENVHVIGGEIKYIDLPITIDGNGNDTVNGYGLGISRATVTVTDTSGGAGNGAVIRPVFEKKGHGVDPVRELGGFYIACNAKLQTDENETLIVDNDYRQVGLIRNPLDLNGALITGDLINGLRIMTVSDASSVTVGDLIYGGNSGAYAYVDAVDTATNQIKFHQNEKTGYLEFDTVANEPLYINGSPSQFGTLNGSITEPVFVKDTGDVMFIENRAPILRSQTQIEDIKIIIEF